MKILYYIFKILAWIAMIFCGFLNITASIGLFSRQKEFGFATTLLASIVIGYALILVFLKLKRHLFAFLSSAVMAIVVSVTGHSIYLSGIATTSMDKITQDQFQSIIIRNHYTILVVPIFVLAAWIAYLFTNEAKSKKHSERKLNKSESIL
ncbi:MAG: hypothetical protein K0R90_810 [Oscillospiraceae bacterium]|jgi:hypothetical protein|nr:hypothetical protein [Oscillospiraceae bacterium]